MRSRRASHGSVRPLNCGVMRHSQRIAIFVLAALSAGTVAGQSAIDEALVAAAATVMPNDLTEDDVRAALQKGLWQGEPIAVAVSIPRQHEYATFVFRRLSDGTYSAADASRTVAFAAFGYFGWPSDEYERFETEPVSWQATQNGGSLLRVRVRAWRHGQRYTVTGHYLVSAQGEVSQP
jgi:hypothetical protein